VAVELHREPTQGKIGRLINERVWRRVSVLDYKLGRIQDRLIDPQRAALGPEIGKAMSAATLIAPPSLLPILDRIVVLMTSAEDRDDDWQREWSAARADYFVKCRELLGAENWVGASGKRRWWSRRR
jgi:hypothetical protein